MEHQYFPYVIYKNIEIFSKYRKLDLIQGAIYSENKKKYDKYLDQTEFVKNIQYYGYILLEFKDSANKERNFSKEVHITTKSKKTITYILLLDLESIYTQSTQNFIKVLNRIPEFDDNNRKNNLEILIISHNELNIHLTKKLDSLIFNGSSESGFLHLFSYKYLHFSSERPKHLLTAPQRILNKQEAAEVLEVLCAEKNNLPKIRKVDPICIWLGAEIGDIIEAKLQSEISGIETKYLVVRA